MKPGFLVNAKQIIAYAQWYLSNPLKQVIPHYNQGEVLKSCKVTSKNMDMKITHTYTHEDLKKAHLLIRKAKANPQMLVFGDSLAHSLLPDRYGNMNEGFNTGAYSDLGNGERCPTTVKKYVTELSKQKLVSGQQVIALAKKFNQVNQRRNARRAKWNAHCDAIITKLVKKSPKNVHYRAFLGNSRPSDDQISHEDPKMEIDLIDVYPDSSDGVSDHNAISDPRLLLQKDSAIYADFNLFAVDKSGQVYYKGKAVSVYGNIAYWSARKVDPVDIIDIKSLPDGPSFRKDVTFKNMANAYHDDNDSLSDERQVSDFKKYAHDPYYVNNLAIAK